MIDRFVDFRLHFAVNFLDLVVELRNFRIGRAELRAQFGDLDSKGRLLFAQFIEKTGADVPPSAASAMIAAATTSGSLDCVWR